jgi:uncharacterized protein YecT (DUF1311 family)
LEVLMRSLQILMMCSALFMPASATHAAESCDSANGSQADLNACYSKAYKQSDAELNARYRQITARLKDNQSAAKLLVTAQKAWVGFRDAECSFSTSASAEGSVYPMMRAICLDGLTKKRIDDLKSYLNCEEGDMSCPVPTQ